MSEPKVVHEYDDLWAGPTKIRSAGDHADGKPLYTTEEGSLGGIVHEAVRLAAELAEVKANAPQWVRVEDRLPTNFNRSVLVYCDSGNREDIQDGDGCHYSAIYTGERWVHFGDYSDRSIVNVVRWLPWDALPAPPSPEEE